MRAIILAAGLSMALGSCVQERGAPEDEAVTRRIPQLDNERVEVWKSVILPNQPLSMHRHDAPRVIVALRGGTLTVVTDSGDEREMTWETGSAYWLDVDPPGQLHGDQNRGTEPVEVIVVQLRPPAGGS